MDSPKFSIQIQNTRAIEEATINLDSVSVLTGENGSGKTTISKLLFGFLYTSINFDELVEDFYEEQLQQIQEFLSQILQLMARCDVPLSNLKTNREIFTFIRKYLATYDSMQEFITKDFIPEIKNAEIEKKIDPSEFTRLCNLYRDKFSKNNAEFLSFVDLISDFADFVAITMGKIQKQKVSRTKSFYDLQYMNYFGESVKDWNFNISEYGVQLINKSENYIVPQKSFSDVIYIGQPTIFDSNMMREDGIVHINPNSKLLYANKKHIPNSSVLNNLFSEILHGDIELEENLFSQIFVYKSKDGSKISLSQAADGIKCFATLEMLFKNGHLNSDTLLIIDEPEVHLHPKWIVDYARVIIQINKLLHCTILLASHSPDMISALKYISHKEGVKTSFYLAEKVSDRDFGKYSFRNLEDDIEPIFESFNIALERISQYGQFDD